MRAAGGRGHSNGAHGVTRPTLPGFSTFAIANDAANGAGLLYRGIYISAGGRREIRNRATRIPSISSTRNSWLAT
ncbi:MAG: hypothetical protein MUF81_03615, partial [Verrucomicrobia bacterium]|nr:hypothetical protein [Verrucomicrobiota bacterium]